MVAPAKMTATPTPGLPFPEEKVMTTQEKVDLTLRISQLHLHATEVEMAEKKRWERRKVLHDVACEVANIIYEAVKQLCGIPVTLQGGDDESVSGPTSRNCKYYGVGDDHGYWGIQLLAPVARSQSLYTVVLISVSPDVATNTVRVECNGEPVEFLAGDPSHVLVAAVGVLEKVLTPVAGRDEKE